MEDQEPCSNHDPLFGREVRSALERLPVDADELAVASRLRDRLPVSLARRAAQLHSLRRRARTRFPEGHLPFLTPRGLEQASSYAVAGHRAGEIAQRTPGARIWDATSGVGADSIALATAGLRVWTTDRDPHSLRCAAHNLLHHGLPARVAVADATRPPFVAGPSLAGVVIDPDRRPGGKRTLDPARWSPDLGTSLALARRFGAGCVQLAPAFDPAWLEGAGPEGRPIWEDLPLRMQWTSHRGSLATVDLWCGEWAEGESAGQREVVALEASGEGSATARLRGLPASCPALSPGDARDIRWLANPDPAVIRSGLLGTLALAEGLAPVAPSIAFLGGDHPPRSPLLRPWRVRGSAPLDRKRVRALLREHGVGPVQVLKRGHPERAEVLARQLRGPGTEPGWLAITRLETGHLAYLVEPASGPEPGLTGP